MKSGFLLKLKKSSGIKFFIYPIAFFILSCLLFAVALGPFLSPLGDVLNMVTLTEPPSFDEPAAKPVTSTPPTAPSDEGGIKIVVPSYGDKYGRLIISSAGIDAPVYYGDEPKELRNGVGTYAGTYIPGQRRTILMAGHNNTYFHTLGQAKVGDTVEITTTYGAYVYEITETKVALATDTSAYDLGKQEENLILYTCYPFDTLGLTKERYFVFARYVSGPQSPEETEGES